MKTTLISTLAASALLLGAAASHATPVAVDGWSSESYTSGTWNVAADGSSATQSGNSTAPTFLYGDSGIWGNLIKATVSVDTTGDDDYLGFVLGFNAGDTSNADAQYLLIDWKQKNQTHNFGGNSSPGGTAYAGLAASVVTGTPDTDEFWSHSNLSGTSVDSGVEEIARAANLGSTGWKDKTDYEFTFDFGANNLDVFVDGVKEFALTGIFNNGSFGFMAFSQTAVTFDQVSIGTGSFATAAAVPAPAPLALLGLGLVGIAGSARRRKI